jgi:cytoskeletal protein CcmA (bactofilin family)
MSKNDEKNETKNDEKIDYLEDNTLEFSSEVVEKPGDIISSGTKDQPKEPQSQHKKDYNILRNSNIYLIVFIIILGLTIFFVYNYINNLAPEDEGVDIANQELTDELMNQIIETDIKLGDPDQTLGIESNAVFSNQVLVRGNLDVAGEIRVGSSLDLPGISVSGNSVFDDIQASSMQIIGNTNLQGRLTIQDGLTVAQNATFSGVLSASSITAQNVEVSGTLRINRPIVTAGGRITSQNGEAVGSGGTTSISGNDSAGRININVGNNPPASGCMARAFFSGSFSSNPKVVITPVGSAAAALNYYVNINQNGFSVCATNINTVANSSFSFSYIALD